jgi:ankyrin
MDSLPQVSALVLAAGFSLTGPCAHANGAPIADAAEARDGAQVLALLERQADPNAPQADGTTALHWIVRQDDVELAKRLLAAGAQATAQNRYGISPLYLAAVNGSASMIGLLLDAGADPNEAGVEGETVLMTAARTGAVPAARVLLARGAEVDRREQWHGQTALMWAAAQGHPDMIRELLQHGADVNARSNEELWDRQVTGEPRDKWLPLGGFTPMLFAAREGCLACIGVLAEAGGDLNAATPEGITPLISALINGHYDVAGALLDRGADPNRRDKTGRTALYAAVDFNTMPSSNRPAPHVTDNQLTALDLIKKLLEHGADVNAQLVKMAPYRAKLDRGNDTMLTTGTTPFLRAAKAGDVTVMRLLLEHGADPTLGTTVRSGPFGGGGINPLMAAAGLGTREEDSTGRFKTQAQAIEAIRICLDAGLDINATDAEGRTAVFGAALQGYDEVIRFLAQNGARLDLADKQGHTPHDAALGKAGGFGFAGNSGVVREGTANLIRELLAGAPAPERQAQALR